MIVQKVAGEMALQPRFCAPISDKIVDLVKRILAPLAGYLLRVCVFHTVPRTDCFSRWVMGPLARCIMNIWQRTQGVKGDRTSFEEARLEKSRAFLSQFAEWKVAQTADGMEIKWGLFRADRFNQWITERGGVREGEWIRPRNEADWARLKELKEFKWFEQVGQSFRVPQPVPRADNLCVLRCQGFGRSMPMDKAMIGLHLAAGFDYALFDWREQFTAKGLFEDGEVIYQSLLRENYAPQQIKVMASCRSTFVASRLKELHHAEGVDAVLIHPPPSLRDAVAHQMWPANVIGLLGVPSIEQDGAHFDTIRRIRDLRAGVLEPGRLCTIIHEGDRTLPPDTAARIEAAAREAGCPFQMISERAEPGGPDPHFSEPLKNPAVLRQYFNFLVAVP